MAKISRAQGPSMTTDEFEGAENIPADVKIRRPEIGPTKRTKRKEVSSSDGNSSVPTIEVSQPNDRPQNQLPQPAAHGAENPSEETAVPSDALLTDGDTQKTETPPSDKNTRPARKAAKKATPKAEEAETDDPKSPRVRFTDDF